MYNERFEACIERAGGVSKELAVMYKLAISMGARLNLGDNVAEEDEVATQDVIVVANGRSDGITALEDILGVSVDAGTLIIDGTEQLTELHGFEKVSKASICITINEDTRSLEIDDIMAKYASDMFVSSKAKFECPK